MTDELPPILAEIAIDASPAHVWEVMTDPRAVADWLGCMNFRPEVGATFHMQPDSAKRASGDVTGATHCTIKTMTSQESLAFSWFVPGTPETLVTMSLTPQDDGRGTVVRLVHSGWENFPADAVRPFHVQLSSGWSGGVLPTLKRVAEAAEYNGGTGRGDHR